MHFLGLKLPFLGDFGDQIYQSIKKNGVAEIKALGKLLFFFFLSRRSIDTTACLHAYTGAQKPSSLLWNDLRRSVIYRKTLDFHRSQKVSLPNAQKTCILPWQMLVPSAVVKVTAPEIKALEEFGEGYLRRMFLDDGDARKQRRCAWPKRRKRLRHRQQGLHRQLVHSCRFQVQGNGPSRQGHQGRAKFLRQIFLWGCFDANHANPYEVKSGESWSWPKLVHNHAEVQVNGLGNLTVLVRNLLDGMEKGMGPTSICQSCYVLGSETAPEAVRVFALCKPAGDWPCLVPQTFNWV